MPRPVARGMRAFLYVAIALTFLAGTQLTVLSDHADKYFAWDIAVPTTAVFIGAAFWSASVLLLWAARQTEWVRARVPVPAVFVVATMLMVATVDHIEQFDSVLGFVWIEVYAVVPPIAVVLAVQQLSVPGSDAPASSPLPGWLRLTLGLEALALIGVGITLYASTGALDQDWPWGLTPLTSQAVGTWLAGIGTIAGYVAVRNDRDDMPGASLSYIVLGALLLLGVARFSDDIDFALVSSWVYVGFAATSLAIGLYGARLCLREGRYAAVLAHGGVPVELRERR
jgi:hypothetical protein